MRQAAIVPPALAKREVAAGRTRTTRTFDAGNNTFQTIIGGGSLNYKDDTGAWQPIDDTLTATGATCDNRIVYANALPGVSVAYAANSDAVTETLTLASAAAPSAYRFAVRASGDLTARAAKNGGVEFVDKGGKVVFTFAPPTMHDSAKKKATGKVSLQLGAGGTTVSIVADAAWLKDPARVYPVVIDPDLYRFPTKECGIVSDAPDFGDCTSQPGVWHDRFGGADIYGHMLVKFGVAGQFNSNLAITNATVRLGYMGEENGAHDPIADFDRAISTYRVKTYDWDSSVTWNHPTTGGPNWAGGIADGSVDNHLQVPGGNCDDGCPWTITDIVQGWISGAYPDYGLLFADDQATPADVIVRFGAIGTASQPLLTITYEGVPGGGTIKPDLGSRPFYTIAGSQLDDRTSVGVNVASGNLLVSATDLALPGIGLDFGIGRTYNSRGIYKGAFGDHWTMGTGPDLFLMIFPAPNNDRILQGASGSQTGFKWNTGNNNWDKPDGLDATLTQSGANYLLLYHASRMQYTFDGGGRLIQQQDRNGNTITFAYVGATRQLASVRDTEGRTTTVHYNAQGFIDTITDLGGRQWQYRYEDTAHPTWLTSVVEPVAGVRTRVTSYGYDPTTGNLVLVRPPRGQGMASYDTTFTYWGATRSRVQTFNRAGLVTTFTYTPNDAANPEGAGTTYVDDATAAHNRTTLAYSDKGVITRATDALGNHFDYAYGSCYRPHLIDIDDHASRRGREA